MNNFRQLGRKIASAVAVFSVLLVFVGCDESPFYRPPQQPEKVSFDLLVLDQRDTDGSAFPEGTDVKIALKFISNENRYIEWHKDNECLLFTNKDFLLVFQLDEGNQVPNSYFPVGTPYQDPIPCATLNVRPSYLFGSSVIMALPWSGNPDNTPLIPGRYYTIANFELPIEGEVKRWELRRDFEIY